jgi:hypothetical protein
MENTMNKFNALTVAACLAASTFTLTASAVAAEPASASVPVPGEKVDSGLGDLPHYRQWADPTGKTLPATTGSKAAAKQGKAAAAREGQSAQRYAVTFPSGK